MAELAAKEALANDDRSGVAAAEEFAARLKQECPGVAAGTPEESSIREKLVFETGYAAALAYVSPIQSTLQRAHATEAHLRWSERMLTFLVDSFGAKGSLVPVSAPDLCGDWRAWAASGYRSVPAETAHVLEQGAIVVTANEARRDYGPELEGVIERLLKPYEGPSARRLQRHVDYVRRLLRSHRPAGLSVALQKIEAALGLREHTLSQEEAGSLLIAPPSSVLASDGRRLDEFHAGRAVVAQTGCLACHRIGEEGNSGPGPDLTHVGSKLTGTQIARALINPKAPMPSFRRLPKAKFEAVVEFLSLLH